MSETTTEKKIVISEAVTTLAQRIQDAANKPDESGHVTTNFPVYSTAMEEAGITEDTLNTVKKTEATVFAATRLAVGNIGIEAMKKDEKLDHVQMTVPAHNKDTFTAGIFRSAVRNNPSTGEPTTIYGMTHTSYDNRVASNVGEMSKVSAHLKAVAKQALFKD